MILNTGYSNFATSFEPVPNLDRAKEVLSYHASNQFEYVCGKILILTDLVSKRFKQCNLPSTFLESNKMPHTGHEQAISELETVDAVNCFKLAFDTRLVVFFYSLKKILQLQ